MPVYVYRCKSCGQQFEKRQAFTDSPLTECESCHGMLHKILQPTAIIYKGSGFYSTDYHAKSGVESGNGGSEKSGGSEKDGDSKKNGGSEKKESTTEASKPAAVGAPSNGSKETTKAPTTANKD